MWLLSSAIFVLILLNGFFACAELAVLKSRRSRMQELAESGHDGANLVLQLQENSDRFLATVQIGITVIGATAAALGGVGSVELLKPTIERLPNERLQQLAEILAVGTVILSISYLSLVFGELFPKALALRNPEKMALWVVRPISLLSTIVSSGLRPLTASSQLLLRVFGRVIPEEKVSVSEEEIKHLVEEGLEEGVFDKTEQDLIQSVFEFTDTSVKEIIVPRPKIYAISLDMPIDEVLSYIDEHKFSRYPVFEQGLNNLRGILYYRDLLGVMASGRPVQILELLHPVYYVPETMKVSLLLKEMQRRRVHMAIVVNEHGSIEGLVTLEDLIEEIVGEIHDEYDDGEEQEVEQLQDGALIIDAACTADDLREEYSLPIQESPEYETLGGFMLDQLQSMARGGDVIQHNGYKFTVVDMDERRIKKVKVEREPPDTTSAIPQGAA
tara:strand:- start:8655 stop:9983 length:1329 start_codon:yes stop_codon:yes gene_type:complete